MGLLDYIQALGQSAQSGGLTIADYPAQFGLRAFPVGEGYGGEMMPKTTGHQGMIPRLGNEGSITEYSLGGVNGEPFFPMVTQNMTPEQIVNLQQLEAGLLGQDSQEAQGLRDNAYQEYMKRKALGLSPFMDYN